MKFELSPFIQAMVTIGIIMGTVFTLFGAGPVGQNMNSIASEPLISKIYVAIEGEAKIAVIDPIRMAVIKNIDLAGFSPHNVQVSPDNQTVWVTGNSAAHGHSFLTIKSANAAIGETPDEVIVIDPVRDVVTKRIKIKSGIHLAHVVLTPDSRFAYATSQTEGVIYKIDAKNYSILKSISAPVGSEPHGLRISPDSKYAYIAILKGRSLGILDLNNDTLSEIVLDGAAVQTGITPDNKFSVVSLYDTKKMAVYDVASKSVSYIDLPETSKGPIQMYPTPDSRFMYLADQGYYFGEPSSEWVYKIDLGRKKVVKEIKAGTAPHGVIVSRDGKFVYVTNILSNDVSVIDTATDQEVKRLSVGKEPNGISIWYKNN